MKYYQFMVEGLFVSSGDGGGRIGFHCTFYVQAIGASNGAAKLAAMLSERMAVHELRPCTGLLLKPYYWIHDIWEMSPELFKERVQRDAGFTLFRIGKVESLFLAIRRLYFYWRRRWVLIDVSA